MKKVILLVSLGASASLLLAGCSKAESPFQPGHPTDAGHGAKAGGPATLKVNWTPGKRYVFQMEINQTVEQARQGQTPPGETLNIHQGFAVSVIKTLADGGWELQLEFTSLRVATGTGTRTRVIFDSAQEHAHDSGNPTATMLRRMIGARVQYLVDPQGTVRSLEGYDALLDRVAGNRPDLQATFRQLLDAGTLRRCCSFGLITREKPVHPGESWPARGRAQTPIGVLDWDLKCTFQDAEQHEGRLCDRLEYSGNLHSSTDAPHSGSFHVKTGRFTGGFWFDPALGTPVESMQDQHVTFDRTRNEKTASFRVSRRLALRLVSVTEVP